MHDDDNLKPNYERVILRAFDKPVTIRELMHSSLDRLLDHMTMHSEPQGVVSVTNMDPNTEGNPFAGHTIVLAIDLDPNPDEYEDLEGGDLPG